MSWRIVFLPAYIGDGNDDPLAWADEIIPENVPDEEIVRLADKWNGSFPLKVFTPSLDDPRFVKFREHRFETWDEGDWTVYVKQPEGDR